MELSKTRQTCDSRDANTIQVHPEVDMKPPGRVQEMASEEGGTVGIFSQRKTEADEEFYLQMCKQVCGTLVFPEGLRKWTARASCPYKCLTKMSACTNTDLSFWISDFY